MTFQSLHLLLLTLSCLRSLPSLGRDNPAQGQNVWSWKLPAAGVRVGLRASWNRQEYNANIQG